MAATCLESGGPEPNAKARSGRCGADPVHDDSVVDQRTAAPVHGDVTEQTVLDFVPIARAGKEVHRRLLKVIPLTSRSPETHVAGRRGR